MDPFEQALGAKQQPEQDPFAAALSKPAEDPFAAALQQELPEIKAKDEQEFTLNPAEVQEVAARHGLKPEDVSKWVPLYGGTVQAGGEFKWDQVPAAVAGRTAELLTGGLAPDLIKKFGIPDHRVRGALDDVEKLLEQKRSTSGSIADTGSELLTAIAGGSALFKGAARTLGLGEKATKAAAPVAELTGAVAQGAVQAEEGDELRDIVINTALLLGLKGLGVGVTKARTKAQARALQQLDKNLAETNTVEVVNKTMEEMKPAEDALAKAVLAGANTPSKIRELLTPEEIAHVAGLGEFGGVSASDSTTRAAKKLLGLDNPEAEALAQAASFIGSQRRKLSHAVGAGTSRTQGLKEAAAQQGEEYLSKAFNGLRRAEHALAHLRDSGLDMTTKKGRKLGEVNALRRLGMFASDARHVYDAIDNRYGTELTPLLDHMSNQFNGYTHASAEQLTKLKPVVEATRAVEQTTKLGEDFQQAAWDALNKGEFPSERFTPGQQKVLGEWKKFFADSADYAEQLHTQFPDLKLSSIQLGRKLAGPEGSYVPHQLVQGTEYVQRMQDMMEKSGLTSAADILSAAQREDKDGEALLKGLELWYGADIVTPRDAQDALNKLFALDRSGESMFTSAKALFKRDDQIPDFLLQKDLTELATGWSQNTLRHLFLRDSLAELTRQAETVSGVSPVLGEYVRNHVRDLTGVRRKTIAGMTSQLAEQWKLANEQKALAAKEAGQTAKAAWYNLLSKQDDIMSAASANAYTYFLGLRPDAALRNISQPLFMTAPHIPASNPADAARRVGSAYKRALVDLTTQRPEIMEQLRKAGQIPADQLFEAEKALKSGLEQGMGAKLGRANDKFARLAMLAYKSSDVYNRLVTKHIADDLIEDAFRYAKGERNAATENALLAIQGASPGYRAAMEKALRSGDQEAAKRLMENYLIGHTQFNYNKVSMSEYGRAMGHLFSMFSKWPTSVLGEVLGAVDARSIGRAMPHNETRILWKYLAPTLLAYTAQKQYWEPEVKEGTGVGPAIARLGMGTDLRKWTPGDTLTSIARGELGKMPPALEAVSKMGEALSEGKPAQAGRALLDAALSGVPFGVVAKQVIDFAEDEE